MTAPITHKSETIRVPSEFRILEETNKNGIKCVWSGSFVRRQDTSYEFCFSWHFDWDELKKTGVDGLSGVITVNGCFGTRRIEVNLTVNDLELVQLVGGQNVGHDGACFDYQLIPYRLQIREEVSYDELFLPSELNDTILVIDEKRLHVNKAFLSHHSGFFRALFSSKFKEGQTNEIPIEDVSYADFGLLMSTIYPKTVFPNDKTAEKLLELADRFLIPSVIGHVEHHLLHNTRINSEKIIWMADKYGMTKLFLKCISELDTIGKARKLRYSPEYGKLSKDAKAEILDMLLIMI